MNEWQTTLFFYYYYSAKSLDHCDLCILYTGSEKMGFMLWLINYKYKYINIYTISAK